MKKTLTYLVFLLTMFVSVSSYADFAASQGSGQGVATNVSGACSRTTATTTSCSKDPNYPNGFGTCAVDTANSGKTYYRCTTGSIYVDGLPNGQYTCPQNSAMTGTGSTATCGCNTGYRENKSSSTSTSCNLDDTFTDILSYAAGIGFIATGILSGALLCAATVSIGCASAAVLAISGAGIIAATALDSSSNAPPPSSPTTLNVTMAPGQPTGNATGVHRDESGNLTPSGTGWTQNGDTHTKTATDGTKSSSTEVNTKTDRATHTVTDTSTGKTSTTVITGSGGDSGSGGGGAASSGPKLITSNTKGNETVVTTVSFNNQGQIVSTSDAICQGSSCTAGSGTGSSSGGSSGGGSTGGGDTGGGSTGGSGDCPECVILTNILNTLKGEGTDGAAALSGIEQSLDSGISAASEAFDQAYQAAIDGLPIQDALSEVGLNPFDHMQESASCSLDVNIMGFHNVLSYCAYQSQIHGAIAFFFFLFFLIGVRDIVFERPAE